LPCSETVTTNFDELFEHACVGPDRSVSVIPGGEVRSGERWLLKLHGTLGGDLVFTRTDYLNATSSHAALRGIVQAMLLTRHMLFIGYSLADEDFNQLVHEVRRASGGGRSTLGTALFPESNPHLKHLWPDLSIVSPRGRGLGFAEQVRRLWIAVDWIGMQSSSYVAHLADDSFGEMRTDVEAELSELVARLSSLRSQVDHVSGAGWHELDHFLSRFGSHG
ncbi:MAG: SIR2 family NAD-dependent protein deacylase, partial [Ilumatobacteraceae bacterium]